MSEFPANCPLFQSLFLIYIENILRNSSSTSIQQYSPLLLRKPNSFLKTDIHRNAFVFGFEDYKVRVVVFAHLPEFIIVLFTIILYLLKPVFIPIPRVCHLNSKTFTYYLSI